MARGLRIGHARAYRIAADTGSYAVAGQVAGVGRQLTLAANQGSYAVSGQVASLVTSGSSDPTWTTIPTITFTNGVAETRSLIPYTLNFNPALHRFQRTAGTLPTGVTLNQTTGYVYDGAGAVGSQSGVVITIVDTAAADFAARSAGAYWAENWSSYADATAWYNFWNRGSLVGVWTPKNPSMGSTWTNAWEIVTTAGHVLSGKALRAYMGKNPSPGGVLDNQYAGFPLNGDPLNIPGAFKNKVYIQFCFWTDEYVNYYWNNPGGSPGTKFLGVDQWNALSAGDLGETVIDGNMTYAGFLTGYHQTSGSTPWERGRATPSNSSNIAGQGECDTGSALDGTDASYFRRYGPFYQGMYGAPLNQASLLSAQGVPNANAAIGGVAINRGGITVVELELDYIARRLRVWAAHHGNAPKLLRDTGAGNAYNYTFPGWSGVWITNLIYQANESLNPGRPAAPYTDYSELIVHPNPINFPGGLALPGV